MTAMTEIGSITDLLNCFRDEPFLSFHRVDQLKMDAPLHQWMYGIWFRAQSRSSDALTPSIFREPLDEGAAIYHFMLRNARFRDRCKTAFDWLCTMRHYTLPCRLLDWTENPLVA